MGLSITLSFCYHYCTGEMKGRQVRNFMDVIAKETASGKERDVFYDSTEKNGYVSNRGWRRRRQMEVLDYVPIAQWSETLW